MTMGIFNMPLSKRVSKLFVLTLMLLACSDPFSVSPFEVSLREEFKQTTQKNLDKINLLNSHDGKTFKIALIADAHFHFRSLADAIADMQKRNDFSFIVVVGDITENGLLKEFEIFHSLMGRAGIPYLTVIGNHDYLSNGGKVYEQMFGAFNYSFTFNGAKFIAWDNVIWESAKEADYQWLEETLKNSSDRESTQAYSHVIMLSHIPPFDDQFESHRDRYHGLLKEHDITLSVHGHKHEFSLEEMFDDGIQFLTVGSPQHRTYTELTITPDDFLIRKIQY
jgi:3',5'-cyclic-AMP phosphodiesterase